MIIIFPSSSDCKTNQRSGVLSSTFTVYMCDSNLKINIIKCNKVSSGIMLNNSKKLCFTKCKKKLELFLIRTTTAIVGKM